jgi:hypothetical protein
MKQVFDKLNFKNQREILVLAAPPSFEPELRTLSGVSILRDARKAKSIEFAIAFVTKRAEVDAAVKIDRAQDRRRCRALVRLPQGHVEARCRRDQSGHGLGAAAISRLRDGSARCHRRGLVGAAISAYGIRRRQKAALIRRGVAGAPSAPKA